MFPRPPPPPPPLGVPGSTWPSLGCTSTQPLPWKPTWSVSPEPRPTSVFRFASVLPWCCRARRRGVGGGGGGVGAPLRVAEGGRLAGVQEDRRAVGDDRDPAAARQ